MLKHTKRSSTQTTKSIEKAPRGIVFGAFWVPLGILRAPWGVDTKKGSGDLVFEAVPREPSGPFRHPLGDLWLLLVCLSFGIEKS